MATSSPACRTAIRRIGFRCPCYAIPAPAHHLRSICGGSRPDHDFFAPLPSFGRTGHHSRAALSIDADGQRSRSRPSPHGEHSRQRRISGASQRKPQRRVHSGYSRTPMPPPKPAPLPKPPAHWWRFRLSCNGSSRIPRPRLPRSAPAGRDVKMPKRRPDQLLAVASSNTPAADGQHPAPETRSLLAAALDRLGRFRWHDGTVGGSAAIYSRPSVKREKIIMRRWLILALPAA